MTMYAVWYQRGDKSGILKTFSARVKATDYMETVETMYNKVWIVPCFYEG